jgi:signal transduction histidine kinase
MQTLRELPLFQDSPDDELTWIVAHSAEVALATGEFYALEGEPTDTFFIVLEGELQVTRTIDGKPAVVGTIPKGLFANELPLLYGTPAFSTICAIMPSRLRVLALADFRGLFGACPVFGAQVLRMAAERTQWFAGLLKQQEKMAALGKLAAGLAHELNNPATAARRAARTLADLLPTLQDETVRLCDMGLQQEQFNKILALPREASARPAPALQPLERSDREDELSNWMDGLGVADAWELAPSFVAAGISADELQGISAALPPAQIATTLGWLHRALSAAGLINEIEQSTGRITDLVGAVKTYTFMDRAPLQEVDVHAGLDATLTVLNHKLKGITLIRSYDSTLPRLMARGGELNQVWTNLIDNAIDATGGAGTIHLITRNENNQVMVEVADDGPGIPKELLDKVFEPFFTTKEVGYGTGLGLDISYRIVEQHSGTLEVDSHPGLTRFIVRLPIGASPAPAEPGAAHFR